MKYFILFFILVFFLGCSSYQVQKPLHHTVNCNEGVYAVKSAQCLNSKELIKNLEPYKVIFIGDHHSSKKQHTFTSNIIRDLSKKGYRVHLANEWFTPEDNTILAEYANGSINDANFTAKIQWEKKKGFKFDLFSPLYHAVRDTKGELYGINLLKRERKLISDVNKNDMSKEELYFFNNLDLDVSAHKTLLSPFFSHCHKAKNGETNAECITRMYRVQVAWDTKMAIESAKLSNSVLNSDKDKLIVFVGAFHLEYGLGVNLRFARESNIPFITMLPQRSNHTEVMHGEADLIYIYNKEQAAKDIEEKLIKDLREKNKNR